MPQGIIADLMPATGHQDHTTSPYASPVFAKGFAGQDVARPRVKTRDDAEASTASRSNVRDDGQRPSLGTGRRIKATDLPPVSSLFLKIGSVTVEGFSLERGDLPVRFAIQGKAGSDLPSGRGN